MSHFTFSAAIEDNLYSAETVRAVDRAAAEAMQISPSALMSRAGGAAFSELLQAFGQPTLITLFCGAGNNGGDGYVIAALAAQRNIPVKLYELGDSSKYSEETQRARQFALESQVDLTAFNDHIELSEGVVVDSLLGTGCRGELRQPFRQAVDLINSAGLPVLSVDIPSGLNADTGAVEDSAVKADLTVTFIAGKKGLFTGRGPSLCGDIVYHSLEVPEQIFQNHQPQAQLMDLFGLMDALPQWPADVHKHQRGHSMVIGGDQGYGGAAIMAAEASLRSGCGLTSVATQPQHIGALLARCPEVMACGVTSGQQLEPWLERPTVLIVGPGLGRSAWSEQLLQKALATELPMVVDADALNILADGRVLSDPCRTNWVLTPHPGEAARLLDTTVAAVQADRFAAVTEIQRRYGGVVLLKGAGTLIAGQGQIIKVCPYGNSAMATAGMGDILSGIIGSLLAQGLSLQMAAELGCCIHSAAADMAVDERGDRGLVATDTLTYVHRLLNRDLL
jgi:NAD(P)H-hydrate epimerase